MSVPEVSTAQGQCNAPADSPMVCLREEYLRGLEENVRAYYDSPDVDYAVWMRRYRYYYARKLKVLRHLLPRPGRVLEIGCGLGENLEGLNPEYGLGIDSSERMIEAAKRHYPAADFPNLEFRRLSAFDIGRIEQKFDSVILVNSITEIPEVTQLFQDLHAVCTPATRIVVITYNYLLAPFIAAGGRLGLSPRRPVQNWFSRTDLHNIIRLSGHDLVREGADFLFPAGIPLVSDLLNRFAPLLPIVRQACLLQYAVFRPLVSRVVEGGHSVSVCIPCKNEEENIADIVARVPSMGSKTELIFVDDCSSDGTRARVEEAIQANRDKTIKLMDGPGRGKGAAVRAGFAAAENDVLMILDADMTVMPEELPQFLKALESGRAEFINGSRLVYPLERMAMRFANVIGNKLFAVTFTYLLSQPIKDTLCGTKVIWRDDYPKMVDSHGYFGGVDVWGDYDWIFGAARFSLKIVDYPVHYRVRSKSETKMTRRLANAMVMLKMCWRAFWKIKVI